MSGNVAPNGLWVEQTGEGEEVLLLLHGMGANGGVWEPLLNLAAEQWQGRIVVPDLRGHGRSKHSGNYSLGTFASDIAELLNSGDRVSVIGHSLGGALGALLGTAWFGHRLERVLALSVKTRWSQEELDKGRSVARNPTKWMLTREDASERFLKVAGLTGLETQIRRSIEAGVVHDANRYRLAIDQGIFGSGALGVANILRDAACPIVLATGSADPIAPAADMISAGFDPHVIDGAGPNVHVTAAAEVWSMLLNMCEARGSR
jgi:pimeloyl-ACP methyl ester carboxylesterase